MGLQLEVEFLSGLYFGSFGPESKESDWPPQPDRAYSALVAAWAARGKADDEAEALEWLERQEPPEIHAPSAEERSAPVVFVPPNDPRVDRKTTARQVLPQSRPRQPRRFPAARPRTPVLRFVWRNAQSEQSRLQTLNRIAADVSYLGHSSSLTRCRFGLVDDAETPGDGFTSIRTVYPGRLEELRQRFEAGHRPLPGAPVAESVRESVARTNVFGTRWLILEHVGGTMPDVRAASLVARAIRHTIMSGYAREGMGENVPQVVSGHTPNGEPTAEVHIAVAPLSFVGFQHADGHVLGFALIAPHGSDILDDPGFLAALRKVAPMDAGTGRRIMTVRSSRGTAPGRAFSIDLSPTFEPPENRRSLDPRPYLARSSVLATVTPITLDRHLKARGEDRMAEIEELVSVACERIGLPRPISVVADKHAALEGAPSAYPPGNAPEWTRWRVPNFLRSRPLTHAVVRFEAPVDGPVLLGAGRFVGLGLCRAVRWGAGR